MKNLCLDRQPFHSQLKEISVQCGEVLGEVQRVLNTALLASRAKFLVQKSLEEGDRDCFSCQDIGGSRADVRGVAVFAYLRRQSVFHSQEIAK